jgi:hypothetical protein
MDRRLGGAKTGLDVVEKRQISSPRWELNPQPPIVQAVATPTELPQLSTEYMEGKESYDAVNAVLLKPRIATLCEFSTFSYCCDK